MPKIINIRIQLTNKTEKHSWITWFQPHIVLARLYVSQAKGRDINTGARYPEEGGKIIAHLSRVILKKKKLEK